MSDMLLPPGNELYLAAGLTPAAGETSALEKTISMWLTRISLKRETQGSSCFQSDGTKVHASAFKIDEVDPTGAGDCFGGAPLKPEDNAIRRITKSITAYHQACHTYPVDT